MAILADVPAATPRAPASSARRWRAVCQGSRGSAEPDGGQPGDAPRARRPERRQRPGGPAELHGQMAPDGSAELARASIEAEQPARRLEPEGDRKGVLQQGSAGHHGVAVGVGEIARNACAEPGQVGVDQPRRGALGHQHGRSVQDVLAGRAAVHPAARRPPTCVAEGVRPAV